MPYSVRAAQQRRLAAEALRRFGLAGASYQLLKLGTTATFRVVSPAGELSALRVQPLRRMPLRFVQSELRWLVDLRHHTALRVPVPRSAPNGDCAVLLPSSPDHETQIATRLAWLSGRHKQHPTFHDAERMGATLATLHQFSSTYRPPSTFERWHFDGATFLANTSLIEQNGANLFSATTRNLVRAAVDFVRSMLPVLDSESTSFGLIHADTNLTNWLFQGDDVALLDFESCCYGYYLFDVGRLLHELAHDRRDGAARMIAFYQGYTRIRPLPAPHDPRMRAGMLMSLIDILSWVCTLEPDMQTVWGEQLVARALTQIQQVMHHC